MTVLHYEAKVKQASSFTDELNEAELSKAEIDLTKTLIKASTLEDFDYSTYRDTYVDKLTQVIESKVAGEELVAVPDPEEPKILNLMDALKQSVAASQGGESKRAASSKKKPNGSKKKTTTRKAGEKKGVTKKKMAPSAGAKKSARKKSG